MKSRISLGIVLLASFLLAPSAQELVLGFFQEKKGAIETKWTNKTGDGLWSTAGNWSNGLPDRTKVVILDNFEGSNTDVKFDKTVRDANRVVAGIVTRNFYSGTLFLSGGNSLTVSSLPKDNTTGFKWGFDANHPNISQTADTVLIITGGASGDSNKWTGGIISTINNTSKQGKIYIQGGTTLLITQGAMALGSNIIIGADNEGGSTLEFKNQNRTLQVNNNACIEVRPNSFNPNRPNQILFNGDVTQGGTVTKGFASTGPDSFIDNFGVIKRSNSGMYQIGLPIRNNRRGKIILESNLWISGKSRKNTADVSLDQEGGQIILENGAKLKVDNSVLVKGGELLTSGESQGLIQGDLDFQGGTMDFFLEKKYGSLKVAGNMSWTGGIFKCYLNGGKNNQQTQLMVFGKLTLDRKAHLEMNVVGRLTGTKWSPVHLFGERQGFLSFDSKELFRVSYPPSGIGVNPNNQ